MLAVSRGYTGVRYKGENKWGDCGGYVLYGLHLRLGLGVYGGGDRGVVNC